MNVNIVPYARADLDTVASVWLSSWRSTGLAVSKLVSFDELRSRLTIEVERGWSVYVAANAQNKGVGKVLLDVAKAQRPRGFHLDTAAESGAVRFYEREGLTRWEVETHPRFGHPIVRYDWLPG